MRPLADFTTPIRSGVTPTDARTALSPDRQRQLDRDLKALAEHRGWAAQSLLLYGTEEGRDG